VVFEPVVKDHDGVIGKRATNQGRHAIPLDSNGAENIHGHYAPIQMPLGESGSI
jgi:hypothetical protein